MSASSVQKIVDKIALQAAQARSALAQAAPRTIDSALRSMAVLLHQKRRTIHAENDKDIQSAQRAGLSSAMIDRLVLTDKRIDSMIQGIKDVCRLHSPVGTRFDLRVRPNGLKICKIRVPIGVVAIIYESRPNVTVDAAAICLKSLNAVVLRGGSEAIYSNKILAALFAQALASHSLPRSAVQLVPTTDRRAIDLLLRKSDEIDLVIPRGGEGLIRTVAEKSLIPVIKHYKGICHVFISRHADMRKALDIAVNAKVQRPGVCNAMETLLIDAGLPVAKKKAILDALFAQNVRIVGDAATRKLDSRAGAAKLSDWTEEYLDLRLSVRCVRDVTQAIEHINTYGSRHTDAIVSESKRELEMFLASVDSSSVMANASTRFSDGGEYGMGCEIGISTDKLHARGPMGVDDLTTYKWLVEGSGQIRT